MAEHFPGMMGGGDFPHTGKSLQFSTSGNPVYLYIRQEETGYGMQIYVDNSNAD